MTEKTLTTENIKPALDALRGELAPWPVMAMKQDRLNDTQKSAVNSGITSSLVAQIIANTAAIRALESAITGTGLRALVVASLPAIGTKGILYIVPVTTYDPATDADVVNYSNEYIWIVAPDAPVTEGYYEQVGQTGIVINNGQLNITVNGTSVGTFTANQSGDTTAAITVPTNADYVDRTTDQTVAGDKTWTGEQSFTLPIVGSITGTASKAIADEDGTSIKTGYVNVAGNQTVTGDKSWTGSNTFNNILPNATNTYSLGSSSYQWSSVYSQTYYYNGTEFQSKFVTTDTAQTISGAKTFSSPIKTAGHKLVGDFTDLNDAYYNNEICKFSPSALNNPTGGYGTVWTVNAAVNVPDNPYNSWISQIALYYAGMKRRYRSNGGEWTSWENILTESNAKPSTNGTQDLGTSTNKWKTLNGINPGALGMPSTKSDRIALDITNWDKTNYTINSYSVPVNGWMAVAGSAEAIQIENITKGYGSTFTRGADSYCEAFLPVCEGDTFHCRIKNGGTNMAAFLYPCLGNV